MPQIIGAKVKFRGKLFRTGEARAIIRQEQSATLQKVLLVGASEVAIRAPRGASHALVAGIRGKQISAIRGVITVEGPAKVYAAVVEAGRQPTGSSITIKLKSKARKIFGLANKMQISLRRWIEKTKKGQRFLAKIRRAYKIKNEAQALRSATFILWRSIHQKGFPGQFFFKKAFPKVRRMANQQFRLMKERIVKRLNG